MNAVSLLPHAVYRRSKEPGELPGNLRLKALEWSLYFAVTGKHTAAELARQMRAETAENDHALVRLMNLGLIQEQELDASEYVRALAAAGDHEEKGLREFLMGAVQPSAVPGRAGESEALQAPVRTDHESSGPRQFAQPPAFPPPPRLREAPGMTAPVHETAARPRRPMQPSFGFKPLPSPDDATREKRPMSESRRLSLRAVMNLIEGQADSREAGQLDIYRVFVRVDTQLLRRNGIETLRFTEDRLVSDPELEQAIVRSVKKTLGLNCPENVWVEVA